VQDDVIRLERRKLVLRGADEHVAGEQGVPRLGADQADADAVGGVGAGIQVLGEQLAPLQVGLHAALEDLEVRRVQLLVAGAPPDVIGNGGVVHGELVLHGPPGVDAGLHDQRALGGQPALAPAQRVRHELHRGQVGMDRRGGVQAGAGQGAGQGGRRGGAVRRGRHRSGIELMIHGRAPLGNPAWQRVGLGWMRPL